MKKILSLDTFFMSKFLTSDKIKNLPQRMCKKIHKKAFHFLFQKYLYLKYKKNMSRLGNGGILLQYKRDSDFHYIGEIKEKYINK